jgi:toxin ParE1/3/4
MTYQVFLTNDAALDLEGLYDYIELFDAPEKADYVLDEIEKAFSSLSGNPQCGAYPNELLALGLRQHREIHFKPYRIIYRVIDESVYVMVIADGRRDMLALLQRRLLQPTKPHRSA